MSLTSWTPMWSGRAWTLRPAWRRWRGCQWQRWSAGRSRQGPSGCWRTWRRTGPSGPCWPRCWRSSGSSWARPMLAWAGRWRPSCSRSQPLPTTLRSCCGWRAMGPPVRTGLGSPPRPTSASSRRSCGAWACCGSWLSGLSGPCGTCDSSPSPALTAARPPAHLRALEGAASSRQKLPWGSCRGKAGVKGQKNTACCKESWDQLSSCKTKGFTSFTWTLFSCLACIFLRCISAVTAWGLFQGVWRGYEQEGIS